MAWLRYKMDLTKAMPKVVGASDVTAGVLEILDSAGKVLATYNRTTSGGRSYQKPNDQYQVGRGPIPSCRTAGLTTWRAATESYYLPTQGVEGQFFSITPDPHTFGPESNRVTRREFGIHFDSNFGSLPGSAGCIVFTDSTQWTNFQNWMRDYRTKYLPGAKTINLIVEYA
jgi:hypothetical protein